jgi:hypothetical protein
MKVLKDIDKQSKIDKAVFQARMWAPVVSNLSIFAGSWAGMFSGRNSNALFGLGFVSGLVGTGSEAEALATGRNDAYMPRLAMTAYDTAWSGLYFGIVTAMNRKRGGGGGAQGAILGATALIGQAGSLQQRAAHDLLPGQSNFLPSGKQTNDAIRLGLGKLSIGKAGDAVAVRSVLSHSTLNQSKLLMEDRSAKVASLIG